MIRALKRRAWNARPTLRFGTVTAIYKRKSPASLYALFVEMAERARRHALVVLFDGGCPLCRRTVRQLRAIDWLGKLHFVDGTDGETRERVAPGLTEAALLVQMYVVDPRGERYAGFESFLKIGTVVPLLWPFAIVGRLPGIRSMGHLLYRTIAVNRVRRGRCTDDLCEPLVRDRRV